MIEDVVGSMPVQGKYSTNRDCGYWREREIFRREMFGGEML
jgi:hypothetical protein